MMEFPYIQKRGIYYPIVPLKLIHQGSELITDALVDSGAVISVFQASISDYFGIDIFVGGANLPSRYRRTDCRLQTSRRFTNRGFFFSFNSFF